MLFSILSLVISFGGVFLAYKSYQHSRASAISAHRSAEEAKRANDLQAAAALEQKQANLRFEEGVTATLSQDQVTLHAPVSNMGLGIAHNVRFFVTIGDQVNSTINKNFHGMVVESMAPGQHLTFTCEIPRNEFRYFTGRTVVELVYDDLEKTNKLSQRNAWLDGSHESGEYKITYR